MRVTIPGLLWLLPAAVIACAPPPVAEPAAIPEIAPSGEAKPLEVIALANEGFLLRSGEQAVLIDAFLAVPYAGYDALPAPILERLVAAEAPFDGVDLALVSHEHADHVQAAPARQFLEASPETLLISSPGALAIVEGEDGWRPRHGETRLPRPGESSRVERAGIDVEFLRLSHGSGRFEAIQNLGHVITIGGQRVVHLGDAATATENFAPYRLADRDLDVALVPYWYFLESGGRRLVEKHLLARNVIACHIPAREREEIARKLAVTHPHVIVPDAPLQTWTIEARAG